MIFPLSFKFFQIRFLSIIFYGSDNFSINSLEAIYNHSKNHKLITSLHVLTSSNNNLVANFAQKRSIPIKLWPYTLPSQLYDLGIVASFRHLIDETSIKNCKYGMINVHPSLLPRWRGSTPIQATILNNDSQTGVTIITVEPHKFDNGRIILQKSFPILSNLKAIELHKKLSLLGASMLIETIENLNKLLTQSYKQVGNVTVAYKLKKNDGFLNFHKMKANEIFRRVLAYEGFIDIFTYWFDKRKLFLYDIIDDEIVKALDFDLVEFMNYGNNAGPGIMTFHKKRKIIGIKCSDLNWVAFKRFSLPNYRQMEAVDFYNGFISKLKERVLLNYNKDCKI